jgi:hemoglobin
LSKFVCRSALLIMMSLSACAVTPQKATLYERIGGHEVLTIVVDETIDKVAHDPKTHRSFEGVKLKALKESIVSQLCELSEGPCKYEGETMKNAHQDTKITEAEFELMVAALRDALNRHTATREKNELLRLLAPMKRDIVSVHP